MIYTCKQCGREFRGKPSARRVYCSKECHDVAQTIGDTVPCNSCGKLFHIPPSKKSDKRHFCSNECRTTWLSNYVKESVNIPGHSKGHKAPHLSKLNKERNPLLALEPDAIKRGKYSDHRRIMEKILGRKLKRNEDVHHVNGIHSDNRPENLVVMDHADHLRLHWKMLKEKGVV